jgi:hypothetical protein
MNTVNLKYSVTFSTKICSILSIEDTVIPTETLAFIEITSDSNVPKWGWFCIWFPSERQTDKLCPYLGRLHCMCIAWLFRQIPGFRELTKRVKWKKRARWFVWLDSVPCSSRSRSWKQRDKDQTSHVTHLSFFRICSLVRKQTSDSLLLLAPFIKRTQCCNRAPRCAPEMFPLLLCKSSRLLHKPDRSTYCLTANQTAQSTAWQQIRPLKALSGSKSDRFKHCLAANKTASSTAWQQIRSLKTLLDSKSDRFKHCLTANQIAQNTAWQQIRLLQALPVS